MSRARRTSAVVTVSLAGLVVPLALLAADPGPAFAAGPRPAASPQASDPPASPPAQSPPPPSPAPPSPASSPTGGIIPSLAPPSPAAPSTAEPTTEAPPSEEPSPEPTKAAPTSKAVVLSPKPIVTTTPPPVVYSYVPPAVNTAPVYNNPAPAPTDFAATDGGTVEVGLSPVPDGGTPSPVLQTRSQRTTKKLGHFSVTDLLLVLIVSAGGVAVAGAGGLWVTRR